MAKEENRKEVSNENHKENKKTNEDKKWSIRNLITDLRDDALDTVAGTAISLILKLARNVLFDNKSLAKMPDRQLELLSQTGHYVRDLREVAGLTVDDLADAIDLSDKSILEAVEAGTATLSFELILRLSAVLARYDPVPFILQFIRTYSPETWEMLDDWGIARIPMQFERERRFVSILRRHHIARELTDDEFMDLLKLTDDAFRVGLNWYHRKHPEWSSDRDDPAPLDVDLAPATLTSGEKENNSSDAEQGVKPKSKGKTSSKSEASTKG
ncbi:MAG: XRE family transcriptional regulator [Pseudomonadales bacterium]|nr:XRE family transcriptional regulator [Pseudomonadales bacterium]